MNNGSKDSRFFYSLWGSGAIAIDGGVAAGAGGIAAGRDIHIHVEPFKPPDEVKPTRYPPERLISRLGPIRGAIQRVLSTVDPEQEKSYLDHVDQVVEYLNHFVGLLPPDEQLSEPENFTLLAAAYLHDIGCYFPQPEQALVLKDQIVTVESRDSALVKQLVRDHYHELSREWIQNSLVNDDLYPSLGLTRADPISEIALVCKGHRDPDLTGEAYRVSGTGPQRMRPALLAALLSLADMLALVSSKPGLDDLRHSQESLETQVFAWLRYYLERVSIQLGHIRLHYQLPTDDYSPSVKVLLSGPIHLRLGQISDVLTGHGLVVRLDSSVTSGPVREMPPDVLAGAQELAHQRVTSVIGALGKPSRHQLRYSFTGLRGRPTLRWRCVEGADHYQCQAFDLGQHLIGSWETTDPEITLPEDQIKPGVKYEWVTDAYRGRQRLDDWEGGIFWLIDEQTARWVNRQMAWYDALPGIERQLMQARVLSSYGLYEEAVVFYRAVLEQGTDMPQLQAYQELMALYEDIYRQLDDLGRHVRADQYLDSALTIAKEVQTSIEQERSQ